MREQVPERVGDHALGRLDAAEEEHRRIGDRLLVADPACGVGEQGVGIGRAQHRLAQRGEALRAGGRQPAPRGQLRHGAHDRVVPAQHALDADLLQPQRVRHHRCGQRPGEPAAQIRTRPKRGREARRLRLDERREPLQHRRAPERPRERLAVSRVLRAVECQHRRPHDAARGEPRVVDRERRVVAHDLQRALAREHQPRAERGHPRDRPGVLAQAREGRVRVPLQLVERRRLSAWRSRQRSACARSS